MSYIDFGKKPWAKSYQEAFIECLEGGLCDVLILHETKKHSRFKEKPMESNPNIPLYRLLNATLENELTPLIDKYDTFILHACRSLQEKSGGVPDRKGQTKPIDNKVYTYKTIEDDHKL